MVFASRINSSLKIIRFYFLNELSVSLLELIECLNY